MASSRKSQSIDPLETSWTACAERYVRSGQTLLVGLSGGIDSVSLLHWLKKNLSPSSSHLAALHVNHGLSNKADAWAEECRTLCDSLEVPLSIVRVQVERNSKDGLESAARRARYSAFTHAGADWVVLGHHRADQAETVLFQLLRGSGVRGAGGMRLRNGRTLRPWLGVDRSVIRHYARKMGLRWIDDDSNDNVRFSRNFLRHQVMPVLRQRFPAAEARFAAASKRFSEAQELLDELARNDLGYASSEFPVPVAPLAALSDARARNLLAYLLHANGVNVPSERRLSEALRQLLTAAPDRHPLITLGQFQLIRCKGMISLVR